VHCSGGGSSGRRQRRYYRQQWKTRNTKHTTTTGKNNNNNNNDNKCNSYNSDLNAEHVPKAAGEVLSSRGGHCEVKTAAAVAPERNYIIIGEHPIS